MTRKPRPPDPRRMSLLLPPEVVEEMRREADRLGVSISRVAQEAWRKAREKVRDYPDLPR